MSEVTETAVTRARLLLAGHADRLAVAAAILIAVLSFLPQSAAAGIPVNDTLNHFAAYCALSLLALVRRRTVGSAAAMFGIVIAFGGLIEVIQPYFGRAGELSDFIANGVGAIAGGLLVMVARRVRKPFKYARSDQRIHRET
ncbi:MAG: hypothetical protein ACR2PM_07460 [Hyphomicrobiales bacterium]